MTHAALKDLLTRALPFLHEAAEPFEDDGGNEPLELARAIESALESPAALSAMEGEAVPFGYLFRPRDGSPWQFEEGAEIPDVVTEHLDTMLVYTAPPPQQAASIDADSLLVAFLGRKPDASDTRWNQMRRAVAEVTRNGMVRRVLESHPGVDDSVSAGTPATQPQQAGEVVVTTDEPGRCVMVSRQDDEHRILSVIWEAATPPAHQPGEVAELRAEVERLNAIINKPQADDFLRAVSTEAEHQRQRWGNDHDGGKTPADWFWLIGYLAGKALHSTSYGLDEKAEHHVITTAAACANWHRAMKGETNMRPGIDGAAALAPKEAGHG